MKIEEAWQLLRERNPQQVPKLVRSEKLSERKQLYNMV